MQQLVVQSDKPDAQHPAVDCRVYERKACMVPTTCQPASVLEMKELQWSATICDISLSGARLTLQRRFEKGTGLAIELTRNDRQEKYVVFVKVIHVHALENGAWVLGCKFISELSEDELRNILNGSQEGLSPPTTESPLPPEHTVPAGVAPTDDVPSIDQAE